MLDLLQLVDLLSRTGLLGALTIAIWGGMRGWYVWKASHESLLKSHDRIEEIIQGDLEDMTKDRDFWRDQAIQALTTANKAVHIAKTTTEIGTET